jgi:nucleoid-associated protein YgaU
MSRGGHRDSLADRPRTLTPVPGRHRRARRVIPGRVLFWSGMAVAAGALITGFTVISSGSGTPRPASGTVASSTVHAPYPAAALPGVSAAPARTPPPVRPAPGVTAPPRTYTVRYGDSAWLLAYRTCGNGNDWRALAHANPSVNVWELMIGEVIDLAC